MVKKIILTILISIFFFIQDLNSKEDVVVKFDQQEDGSIAVLIQNVSLKPYTVNVDLTLTNMKSTTKSPILTYLESKGELEIAKISVTNSQKEYYYKYQYWFTFGDINAKHNDSYVYTLPYESGKSFKLGQGYNSAFSHNGAQKYALDFIMDEGTPILAAREGIVVDAEDSFTEGGIDPDLKDKANYVSVLQDDGTIAQYLHLRNKGVEVTVGDKVSVGDLLGYSGNVGFSSSPHLHFHIYKPTGYKSSTTIPTFFNTKENGKTKLIEGMRYTRP